MAGSLGHIAGTVSLDINPFENSASKLTSTIRSMGNELKANQAAFGKYGNSLNSMKTIYSNMGRQMEAYQAQLRKQKSDYEQLAAAAGKNADGTQKVTTKMANASSQINTTNTQIAKLNNEMGKQSRMIGMQESGWAKAGNEMTKFGNAAQKVGGSMSNVGNSMTTHFTLPIVAGFAAASKKAIDFQNTMNTNKNLIVTGGESAKEAMRGVNAMQADSLKYSNKYGKSQQEIAEGYQDLIKRGYTSKQALGAMNSELQASVATGDDFKDVVQVSSQTLESFGMKANTTAGMTRNTKKAVNELAFAADATSTDFQSLGVGMSYVGATAHNAGFSLSETASAMGILSNNGLEADKAGTSLRKVINSLISPSKNATKALQGIGLSTKDFVGQDGKMKSMTDIFGILNNHMKNLSAHDKQDVFHAIFGTTGQQAGAILSENATQLGELNNKVADASKNNYVGSLSEKNLKSAKNQLEIFKQSVINLGMTMAKDLLPALQPVIKNLTSMTQAFGKLDKGTQQTIVKTAALIAAAGPLLSITGKLTSGLGGLAKGIAAPVLGIARMTVASKQGATGLGMLQAGFSKTAFESGSFATKTGTAAKGAVDVGKESVTAANSVGTLAGNTKTAAGAFAGLGPQALVAAAAVAGGVAVWELWGKKAVESGDRTATWGSDVGKAADTSLTKMKHFSENSSIALDTFSTNSKTNSKTISNSFHGMANTLENDSKRASKEMNNMVKGLPKDVASTVEQGVKKTETANKKMVSQAQQAATNVSRIVKNASSEHRSLTDEERVYIGNAQQKMVDSELSILKIGGSKKKAIVSAINGDVKNMNAKQLADTQTDIEKAFSKENSSYEKQRSQIKKLYDSGVISSNAYKTALDQLGTKHQTVSDKMIQGYVNVRKKEGDSMFEIKADLSRNGIDYDKWSARVKQNNDKANQSSKTVEANIKNVSNSAKKAGNEWNGIVLDPKTGKVKTNAKEEVEKSIKSKDGWNRMQFIMKNAKIGVKGKELLTQAIYEGGRWNQLSFKQQQAITVTKGGKELENQLSKWGMWNNLTPKQQYAIAHASGKEELAEMVVQLGVWNKLTPKEQRLLANDEQAAGVLQRAGIKIENYNTKKPKKMMLTGDNTSVVRAADGSVISIGKHNKQNPKKQNFLGNASNIINASGQSVNSVGRHNAQKPKTQPFKGDSRNVVNESGKSVNSVTRFNGKNPNQKYFKGHDQASGPANTASRAVQAFRNLPGTINKYINVISRKIQGKATGDNNFEGGDVVVNDQKGSTYEEMIRLPNGETFVPQGRNVMLNLPKHTQIVPAHETKRLLQGVPKFAQGTDGYGKAIEEFTKLPSSSSSTSNVSTNNNQTHNEFKINVNVDGNSTDQEIGRKVAQSVERELRKLMNSQTSAIGGGDYF